MILEHFMAKRTQALDNLCDISDSIELAAQSVLKCLSTGGRLFTCGNGGSAAQAMHFVSEMVGRFTRNRDPLPAICLNADCVLMSSIVNDLGPEKLFSRQVQALAMPSDLLCCFSTSGQSPNVIEALKMARQISIPSLAFLGCGGGNARHLADQCLIVPSTEIAII